MYLEKTAAAISSLQKIHRKNNSPQSPLSPMRKTAPNDFTSTISARNNYEKSVNLRPLHLHKRNLSLDVTHNVVKSKNREFYDSNDMLNAQELKEQLNKRHTRHNSYENKQIQLPSPKHGDIDQTMSRATFIEQQRLLNRYFAADSGHHHGVDEHARRASCGDNAIGSPIRRSSSFCNRNIANIMPMKATTPTATKKTTNNMRVQYELSVVFFFFDTLGKRANEFIFSEFYLNEEKTALLIEKVLIAIHTNTHSHTHNACVLKVNLNACHACENWPLPERAIQATIAGRK